MRLRAVLRDVYHSLPDRLERILPGPGPALTARRCETLNRRGLAATAGYFQAADSSPEEIVAANLAMARALTDRAGDVYLSVKAPPLAFDPARLRTIAEAAAAAGLTLTFDAHAPKDAGATLGLAFDLLREWPRTGVAVPARWRRSAADAAAFRDTGARIRLVKGEWPDPEWGGGDVAANYLELAGRLAGRAAPVAVATHDPELAERALGLLLAAGTPCELEQLRGLPRRRTTAVARRLGVPVRLYLPFGPGWWPYAVRQAMRRPYLLSWTAADLLGPPATSPASASAVTGGAHRKPW